MSYEAARIVKLTHHGYPCETIIYQPATYFPPVMELIRRMDAYNAGVMYKDITGCKTRTAILAIRTASKGIPGYCPDCGKKDTASFPGDCRNEVHIPHMNIDRI